MHVLFPNYSKARVLQSTVTALSIPFTHVETEDVDADFFPPDEVINRIVPAKQRVARSASAHLKINQYTLMLVNKADQIETIHWSGDSNCRKARSKAEGPQGSKKVRRSLRKPNISLSLPRNNLSELTATRHATAPRSTESRN